MNFGNITENAKEALNLLDKGAFLTTKSGTKQNVMVISWGCLGQVWGKPSFMIMVRESRYTHELLEESGEFTVTIPKSNMFKAIGFCGSKSGRDVDKFTAMGLKPLKSKAVGAPVIDCNAIQYECKVMFKTNLSREAVSDELFKEIYEDDNSYHTLYFGEVLETYETK